MGFLKRLVASDPPPPDWASFFSPAEYREFLSLVEADLRRRGLDVEMGDGFVTVSSPAPEGSQMGLTNLAQKCHGTVRGEWQVVIAGHFTSLLAMHGRDLDALAADFGQARRILRIRFYPDETMGGPVGDPAKGPFFRAVAPGIQLALVYDFPEATSSVDVAHVAAWPYSEDEILFIARENTLAEPLPFRQSVPVDGANLEVLHGDSFYVASRLLGLGDLLPADAAEGALVAVPNRHTLLWHPIRDVSAIRAVQGMIQPVGTLFNEGPGSISSHVYWWNDGDLVPIPVARDGATIQITPPDAFVELLNRLPEGA
jgi:hypothetical protein